jgi:hypothetical protein
MSVHFACAVIAYIYGPIAQQREELELMLN